VIFPYSREAGAKRMFQFLRLKTSAPWVSTHCLFFVQEFQKELLPGVQLGFGLSPGAPDDGCARFALRGVNTLVAGEQQLRSSGCFTSAGNRADLLGQGPCPVY